MDFKEATDVLFDKIDHDAIANAIGVSVASIRQARLRDGAAAKRAPPEGWPKAAASLARQRISELEALLKEIDGMHKPRSNFLQKIANSAS